MSDFQDRVNAVLQDGIDILRSAADTGEQGVKELHAEVEPVFERIMALPNDENKLRGLRSVGNAGISGLAHIADVVRKQMWGDIIGATVKHAGNILGSVLGQLGKG